MSTSTPLNEEWILAERPSGHVTEHTFKKQSVPYPDAAELKDGHVIAKLVFASVDPYMRGVIRYSSVGAVHNGLAVAEVIASKSAQWKVGDLFFDGLPWRRYTVFDLDGSKTAIRIDGAFLKKHNLNPSVYLSSLGMVSRTAYFGVRDVLQISPKHKTEKPLTVVVSGAAGATGGYAIQFARLLGAKTVIGIAGGKDKCDYLVKELGADAAIDYKEINTVTALRKRLAELAPQGVDRYYDNTGGVATDAIFDSISKYARIAVCGQIALYNTKDPSEIQVPAFLHKLIYKSATVQGFVVSDFVAQFGEFFEEVTKWLAEGKIKDKQHIVHGFDNIPQAFIDMFAGANTGKIVIDCSS